MPEKIIQMQKILLAGCLAERYAKELNESLPEADGFFGNGDLEKIVITAKEVMENKRPVYKFAQKGVCGANRNLLLSFAGTAFVKITEGCNNRCTFCAIPIIRGELRSRPAQEIIDEIKQLLEKGVYEINLIGQDLAAYGTGSLTMFLELAALIFRLELPAATRNLQVEQPANPDFAPCLKRFQRLKELSASVCFTFTRIILMQTFCL